MMTMARNVFSNGEWRGAIIFGNNKHVLAWFLIALNDVGNSEHMWQVVAWDSGATHFCTGCNCNCVGTKGEHAVGIGRLIQFNFHASFS